MTPIIITDQCQYLKYIQSNSLFVPPAIWLPVEPAPVVRRLLQPSVFIKSVRGRSGDRRLQLLWRPRADRRRVLPRSTQGLIHRLIDGAKPLCLKEQKHFNDRYQTVESQQIKMKFEEVLKKYLKIDLLHGRTGEQGERLLWCDHL